MAKTEVIVTQTREVSLGKHTCWKSRADRVPGVRDPVSFSLGHFHS